MYTPALEKKSEISYSDEEILAQLNRILSSKVFSSSVVLCNFLQFVVQQTIAGNTSDLKEYTIGVSALGKPADFNPQIDAIVRIHAGRLRRLLNEYYEGPGKNDLIKIEVIKGSYVPVFRSQIIRQQIDNGEENITPVEYSRSKLTLAVLPFRNLCPDDKYQFFVDGLGEELTRIFSLFQNFAVIAHHSSRMYADVPDDIRTVGAKLGAHYLIDGSVRRTSKEIRISAGLTETLGGKQIWSKSYKYVLNDEELIDIQDLIINDIFSILGGYYGFIIRNRMISDPKYKTPSLQSFDAALWNYYFHMNFSKEAYFKTRKALEKALQHDPYNAPVLAMLGELYSSAYVLGYPTVENPLDKSYELTKRAIEIDPQCQRAYLEHGWACICLHKKEEALTALEYCLELNPSSVAFTGAVGFDMACAGEYKRAFTLLTQSLKLNPHCPWWFYMGLFFVYYHNRQYKEALEAAEKMDASEDIFLKPLLKAAALGQLGLLKEAQSGLVILQQQFKHILADLKMHLGTLILEKDLIDDILEGAKKAGLTLP